MDFYEDLEELELPDLKYAVCGSGDSTYDQFCTAVDLFTAAFEQTGAKQVASSVKIDLEPDAADFAQLDQVVSAIVAL